jgi:hypothetical protein
MKFHKLLSFQRKKKKKRSPVASSSVVYQLPSSFSRINISESNRKNASPDAPSESTFIIGTNSFSEGDSTIVDVVYDSQQNEYKIQRLSNSKRKRKFSQIPSMQEIALIGQEISRNPDNKNPILRRKEKTLNDIKHKDEKYLCEIESETILPSCLESLKTSFPNFDYYCANESIPLSPEQTGKLNQSDQDNKKLKQKQDETYTQNVDKPDNVSPIQKYLPSLHDSKKELSNQKEKTIQESEKRVANFSTISSNDSLQISTPTKERHLIEIKSAPSTLTAVNGNANTSEIQSLQNQKIEALLKKIEKLKSFKHTIKKCEGLGDLLYNKATEYMCDSWLMKKKPTKESSSVEQYMVLQNKGISFLKAAAELGQPHAQFEYGEYLMQNSLDKEGFIESIHYINQARKNAHPKAAILLNRIQEFEYIQD